VPEQAVSSEIGREADEHIALGLLLRQDRPEAKRSAVQKVLSSTLSTAQMVEKIRQIDETQDGAGILRVVRQTSAQSARGRLRRISHTIKKPVKGLSKGRQGVEERCCRAYAARERPALSGGGRRDCGFGPAGAHGIGLAAALARARRRRLTGGRSFSP
jgi:hypothetical protein